MINTFFIRVHNREYSDYEFFMYTENGESEKITLGKLSLLKNMVLLSILFQEFRDWFTFQKLLMKESTTFMNT